MTGFPHEPHRHEPPARHGEAEDQLIQMFERLQEGDRSVLLDNEEQIKRLTTERNELNDKYDKLKRLAEAYLNRLNDQIAEVDEEIRRLSKKPKGRRVVLGR